MEKQPLQELTRLAQEAPNLDKSELLERLHALVNQVAAYDDRDLVRTNLIESYDRILAFVKKHLPDPFYLDGIERRSLRDAIFREVASNMLIHREYASGVPARFIIERGEVTTFNANRPHGFGALDPETFAPYPPVDRDEVYKEIFEQAENFKKYQTA